MGQEEGSLTPTKIELSSKYKFKSETSTSFALSLYISSLSTLLPPSLLLSSLSPLPYNMSQYGSINYEQIIQQQ